MADASYNADNLLGEEMEFEEVDLTPGDLRTETASLRTREIQLGIPGPRGMSAYEVAKAHGYLGTEEEFAAMLARTGDLEWKLSDFKTINGVSILGGGNINISPDGQVQAVDNALSETSENPVQNQAITRELLKLMAQLVPFEPSEYNSIAEAGMLQDRVYLVLEEE